MKELDYGRVGMRIRQIRKAKGWSQEELAKKCGISMSFLGHIERGTRIMSLETLAGICEALDAGQMNCCGELHAHQMLFWICGSHPAKRVWKGKQAQTAILCMYGL